MKKNLPISHGNSSLVAKMHKKPFVIAIALLLFSISGFAHAVTGYSGNCGAGPQYTVTATVINVNSTSNYRWQWKNTSGAWVCFVNGANTINGNPYNVSGSVYNLTTTPGPIVFTNPNSGLQGLEIRMVISDGNGVNPCTLPAGNTWTSTTNHFINVSNTPCATPCNADITNVYFNKLDGGADITITNGSTYTAAQLGSLYNIEASATGTVGSVKFTITGPTASTVIENAVPYNSPGTGSGAWVGAPGSYTLNVKAYSGSGATGTICDEITITFILSSTVSLGNKVWYDANNNGLESGENGIANITVKLYADANNDNVADGASIATTTTNSSGNYLFSNLNNGNYIVGIIIPNGYMSSSVNGGDPDNNTDLDDNGQVVSGNEIRGLAITLAAGAEPGGSTNNTYDFGLLPDCTCPNSASNLLVNASFENGTTGWTWSNGTLTTGTGYIACGAKNGFNNWSSGTSKVWQDVAVVAGSVVTFKAFAGTHTPGLPCSPKLSLIFLNAANTVLGQSDVAVTKDVTINYGQLDQYSIIATAPAGTTKARVQSSITCNTMKLDAFCLTVISPASLGDLVWEDYNRNGVQDAGEPGISGATVVLKDGGGNTVGATTTNASGIYSFTNLAPGAYSVTFTTPATYVPTPSNIGADDTKDSDPVDGVTGAIVLTAGQNNITIDAGFYRLINLSGNVWHDVNAMNDNMVNNTGPSQVPPASAIPVGLRAYLVNSATGLIVRSTIVSSATGTFSFNDISPNTNYRVYISSVVYTIGSPEPNIPTILPSSWEHTGQKLGITPGSDGINDGRLTVPVGVNNVINVNFGIRVSGADIVTG